MRFRPRKFKSTPPAFSYDLRGEILYLKQQFTLPAVERFLPQLLRLLERYPRSHLKIDLGQLEQLDSAGVTALRYLERQAAQQGLAVEMGGAPAHLQTTIETFSGGDRQEPAAPKAEGFWERMGEKAYYFLFTGVPEFFYLVADITYWGVRDISGSRAHRKGEFINQAVLIGVNALPIVALIAFMIGLVLALQSAQQLRQFGANIFITDLVVIAMTREMGPLLTAIMIAGRSGSAITSEIATMVVTEEIDALKTMALNPVRYVVIPKLHASVFTLPLLTIIADLCGILGGVVIAHFYLDLSPTIFYNRMIEVLYFQDIVTGIVKSLVFSGIIVITGSFFGFRVRGGAEGVGRYTTRAVVSAIFLVILADSVLGLIFY